jgi:protein SCO1/2
MMILRRPAGLFILMVVLMASTAHPWKGFSHEADLSQDQTAEHQDEGKLELSQEQYTKGGSSLGLEEKRGDFVSLDSPFIDEKGKVVTLRELISVPTFLVPIYYSCRDVCPTFVYDIAQTLSSLSAKPLEDYEIITYSFNEQDTTEMASQMKKAAVRLAGEGFPESAWHFLTGERSSIDVLCDSIGFRFQRDGEDFIHPLVVAVLTKEGKITRYLYGPDILPLDL